MTIQVNPFVNPQENTSFHLGKNHLEKVATEVIDANHDGNLSQDELQVAPEFRNRLDRDHNGTIRVQEFIETMNEDGIQIQGLSQEQASSVANLLIEAQIPADSMGELGGAIDSNHDGKVARSELAQALYQQKVSLDGNYLVLNDGGKPLEDAKAYLQQVHAQVMSYHNGHYVQGSGSLTHEQAFTKIRTYLESTVLPSAQLSMADKLSLIASEIKHSVGNTYVSGSLKQDQARTLLDKVLKATPARPLTQQDAAKVLEVLSRQTMKLNNGSPDTATGLYKPQEATQRVYSFLDTVVLPASDLGAGAKLSLIASQVNQYQDKQYVSGRLSYDDTSRLIDKVLNQSNPGPQPAGSVELGRDAIRGLTRRFADGQYQEKSGLYSFSQANSRIKKLFEKFLLPAAQIPMGEKLRLIESEYMAGNAEKTDYDYASGSLTRSEAVSMLDKVLKDADPASQDLASIEQAINAVHAARRKREGNEYVNYSGLFENREANQRLQDLIKRFVMPSEKVDLGDKLRLIEAQYMAANADRSGYDNATGSLERADALKLIDDLLKAPKLKAQDLASIKQAMDVINSARRQWDPNAGNYVSYSGLYEHGQAREKLQLLLEKVMLPSDQLSRQEKLNLIESQIMKKKNGNYDQTSGCLTPAETQQLINKL